MAVHFCTSFNFLIRFQICQQKCLVTGTSWELDMVNFPGGWKSGRKRAIPTIFQYFELYSISRVYSTLLNVASIAISFCRWQPQSKSTYLIDAVWVFFSKMYWDCFLFFSFCDYIHTRMEERKLFALTHVDLYRVILQTYMRLHIIIRWFFFALQFLLLSLEV